MSNLPFPAGAFSRPREDMATGGVARREPAGRDARDNGQRPGFTDPDFSGMARRLAFMLDEQIAALEIEERQDVYSEARVRALTALTKTLQAMEDMVQKQEKAKDERDSGPGAYDDIVGFRAAIARKLEALAAAEAETGADAGGEAGGGADAAAGEEA